MPLKCPRVAERVTSRRPAQLSGRRPEIALFRQFMRDESGQDLIEYGLLCGFVTLGVVVAATNLGQAVNGIFGGIDTQVAAIPAP